MTTLIKNSLKACPDVKYTVFVSNHRYLQFEVKQSKVKDEKCTE